MPQPSVTEINLKITYLNFCSDLPGGQWVNYIPLLYTFRLHIRRVPTSISYSTVGDALETRASTKRRHSPQNRKPSQNSRRSLRAKQPMCGINLMSEYHAPTPVLRLWTCRKMSNIRCTLVGNKIVDHSGVVGASPVGAAPTTSSFSTWHLASRDSANPLRESFKCWDLVHLILTHWGRDKMDAISQTTFSITFSWMKMLEFRLNFHWSLFLRVQLTISQHWFR